MASPAEITPAQLSRLIGTPECPALIDVRTDEDYDADPRLIPGAMRHSHKTIEALVPALLGRRVVIVCHHGAKLSAGAAALLRCHGANVESLSAGHVGWVAADLPTVSLAALPRPRGTLWVTRQRPKIDRIACPWLIRRFIDAQARFLFVPTSEVAAVADRFDAIPFDIEGVPFSHVGAACTFDTMLAAFALKMPALASLARIVNAADTDRLSDVPEAAGLLAASLGLSRMYRDDLAQLDAGLALYDAFFRWARDAQDEGHDWPATSGPRV